MLFQLNRTHIHPPQKKGKIKKNWKISREYQLFDIGIRHFLFIFVLLPWHMMRKKRNLVVGWMQSMRNCARRPFGWRVNTNVFNTQAHTFAKFPRKMIRLFWHRKNKNKQDFLKNKKFQWKRGNSNFEYSLCNFLRFCVFMLIYELPTLDNITSLRQKRPGIFRILFDTSLQYATRKLNRDNKRSAEYLWCCVRSQRFTRKMEGINKNSNELIQFQMYESSWKQ